MVRCSGGSARETGRRGSLAMKSSVSGRKGTCWSTNPATGKPSAHTFTSTSTWMRSSAQSIMIPSSMRSSDTAQACASSGRSRGNALLRISARHTPVSPQSGRRYGSSPKPWGIRSRLHMGCATSSHPLKRLPRLNSAISGDAPLATGQDTCARPHA